MIRRGLELDNLLGGKRKKMAALSEILEPRFVERFLIEENNSYEDLVEEIKNQFPGLNQGRVKRFCNEHGIKKHEVPVSNEILDRVVQRAANVFAVVISVFHITVDYTVILTWLYCSTSGTECKRLNVSRKSMIGFILGGPRIWTKNLERLHRPESQRSICIRTSRRKIVYVPCCLLRITIIASEERNVSSIHISISRWPIARLH